MVNVEVKSPKKVKAVTFQPLVIGVTKETRRKMWLNTKVTIFFKDGSQSIETFDTQKEAQEYAREYLGSMGDSNVK
ncbi:MAG: hypothetical protein GQ570_15115 [Helicobacteraceae bacterium]|nr:hypothetical protein [Helicobacteraceae bacterium]